MIETELVLNNKKIMTKRICLLIMMIIRSVVEYKIGIEHAVSVEELSPDDDWVKDDIWDKIYEQEVEKNGKV